MKRLSGILVCVLGVIGLVPATSIGAGAAVPGKPFTETGCEEYSDSVARLYTAGLGREPELGGFEWWLTEYTAGRWSLANAAIFFTESPEFEASYGQLDQDGFIRQLYRNVLGREGEEGGVAFWNGQMDAGMTRGTVLLRFAESPENIANSGTTSPALGEFNEGRTGAWFCSYRFNDGAPASHPGDVVNCADFETQQAAQDYFDYYAPRYGDVAGLDRDDNGIACESLPAA